MIDDPSLAQIHTRVRPGLRGADRRVAFTTFLASLTYSLCRVREPVALRRVFEDGLRRIVPVRDIRLRENGLRPTASIAGIGRTPESLSLEVPARESGRAAVLEAAFDPASGLDEWDVQALTAASHVAALLLEIERSRFARPSPAPNRPSRDGAAPLVGSSAGIRLLRERMEKVAVTDFTVLIEGESGTGKELVARQIHDLSRRRNGPFVAINCAALVETLLEAELFGIEDRIATGVRGRRGKFEHAEGGTLFLDEVSDLSLSAQAKLLRAIQDLAVERVGGQGARRVNTRIVAATNRSLAGMVERTLFRTDLFYRLSGVELRVPPLRQRREDILELARYFLAQHRETRRLDLSQPAADALLTYDWPGNVRELERLMEATVALAESDRIELDDLPPSIRGDYGDILMPSLHRGDTMRAWGSRYARLVLERSDQNKRRACRALGISYHTLQAYLRYRGPRLDTDQPRRAEWGTQAVLHDGGRGE